MNPYNNWDLTPIKHKHVLHQAPQLRDTPPFADEIILYFLRAAPVSWKPKFLNEFAA